MGDLRGHQHGHYTKHTPQDTRHAMKVIHLENKYTSLCPKRNQPHPACIVDLQTCKELPADRLVADGRENASGTS